MFKKYMCLALCLLLALGTMTTTASAASLAVDGLVVSHVSFSDANGPVADLPETASSVTANVTVSNNSATNSSVVLWVGKFVDDVLTEVKYDQKTLTANEQNVSFSATLDNVAKDEVTNQDGTSYNRTVLKAFVWTKLVGGKALAAPATLPSDDTSFVFVTKNGVIWDGFDASVTEQELVLPRTEGIPSIKFFPNDNATKIEEPAKFALGTNTVKVTSAKGTEKTYNLNLRYEDPKVEIEMGTVNGNTAPMVEYKNEPFGPEARPFSDRTQFVASWVGEGLLGGNYFKGTVGRDAATVNVHKGEGTYFSFTPNASGTMYVLFKSELKTYAQKGWTLENNSQPTWKDGSNTKTPYDVPTDKPFFAGYIQWRNDACVGQQFNPDGSLAQGPDANDATKIVNNVQYPNAYAYTYSLKFNAGEKVEVPTANLDFGQYGSNLMMVVKWETPNPDLSSDSTLKSLTYATDGAAQPVPGFSNTQSGNITYDKIVLAEGTTSVTVNAEANDANATVSIDGAAVTSKVVDMTSGSASVVVSVQPEDPALAPSTFTIPFEVEGSTPPPPESDAYLLDESNGALKSATPKATIGTTLLETTTEGTYEYAKGVTLESISDRNQDFVINGEGKNYGYTWTLSSQDYKPGAYDVYVKGTSMGSNSSDSFFIVYNEEKIDGAGGNMFKAPSSTVGDPMKDVATREHIELNWAKGLNQLVIPENGSSTLRITGRENPFIDKVILIPADSELTIDAAEAELCKEYTATFAVEGATVATVLYDDSVVGTAVPTKGWVLNTETNKSGYADVPALVVPEKAGFTGVWAPATLQADGTAFVADYKAVVNALFEDDFQSYVDKMDKSIWKTDGAEKYSKIVKEADGNQYVSLFAVHTATEDQHFPRLWNTDIPLSAEQKAQPIHISGRVQPVNDTVKPSFSLEIRKSASQKAVALDVSTSGLRLFASTDPSSILAGSVEPGNWVTFDLYVTLGADGQDSEFTVVYTGNGLKNAAGMAVDRLVATGKKNIDVVGITDKLPIMFNASIGKANTAADNACINIDDVRVYNDTVPTFSSNAKLSALTYAPNGSNPQAVPGFSAANEGGTYNVDLDAGTTSVTLGATTADTKASKAVLVDGQIVENGVIAIAGATTAVVTVIAEDGTKNDFTVNFTVAGAKNEVTELVEHARQTTTAKAEKIVFGTTSPYLLYNVDEEGGYNKSGVDEGGNPIPGGTNSGAGVFLDTNTPAFFNGATAIRRDKNDGAGSNNTDAPNKPYWGKPGFDGSTGTYWMTFKVSDDATVYVVDREGKGWPNADKEVWKLSKYQRAGKPMYYQKVTAGTTVQVPNYGWDNTWSPSTEAGAKYFFDPSQYVVVWGSDSPEDVVEQNKIQGLTVAAESAYPVYDKNNGYNLGEVTWDKPAGKVMIEDGIKFGSANDANTSQKYSDRNDRFMDEKAYDPYFAGATIIRRPKGDGGSAADVHAGKKKYFTANSNDGKDGRGYWMEFTVSSDCTVFTSGAYQRTWPNKPADWTETTSDYLLFDGQPTVYYKEYKAGDKVQIPSFGYDAAWATDTNWFDPPVYVVVWDSEGKTNPDKNRSTDTKLSELTYKVGENDPVTVTGFDPADAAPKTYNVALEEGTTSVTLSATRADQRYGKTVISVDGVEKTDGVIAVSGDAPTTAVVTVTAHDGTTTGEYSVTFTVGGDVPVLSTNTKLSALTFAPNGSDVTTVPGFSAADAGKTYDKITLAAGTTSVTVGATVADTGKATYAVKVGGEVKDGGVVAVSSAADTTVDVVVTAEDTTVTDTYTLVFAVASENVAYLLDESNGALKSATPKATIGTTVLETTTEGTYEYVKGIALEGVSTRTEDYMINGEGKDYGYTWTLSSQDYKPGTYDVHVKGTSYGSSNSDSFFIVHNETSLDQSWGNMFKCPSTTADDPLKDVATREHIELNWTKAIKQVVIPEDGSYTLRIAGRENPFIDKVILIPADSELTIDAAEAELCKEYTATFAVEGATVATVLYDDSVVGTAVPTKGWVLNTETNKSGYADVPALVVPEKAGFTGVWAPATLQADGTAFVAEYKADYTVSDMTYWNKAAADLPKVVNIVRGTTQAYGSADGCEVHNITSEEFDVAGSVIQRVKGEASNPTSEAAFYVGAYDGKDQNPYWMTFKMNAPGTVYVVDMEGKGWPNNDGRWAVDTTGLTFGLWGNPYNAANGKLYSKHFNANETVEVPNYGYDESWPQAGGATPDRKFTNPSIYLILWDSALPKSASLKSLTYAVGGEAATTVTGFVSGSPSGTYDVGVSDTNVKIAAEAIANSNAAITYSSNVAADGTVTFVDGAAQVVVTVKSADNTKTNTYTINFSVDPMFGAKTYDVPQRTDTKLEILVNPDLIALRSNSGNNEIKPVDPIDNFSKFYSDRDAGLAGSGTGFAGMSFIDVGVAIKGATQIIDPIGDTRTANIRDEFTSKDNEYFRFRATEKGTVFVKYQGSIASYDADPSWTKVVEAGLTPSGINDWKGNGIPTDYVHNTTQFPYYCNMYQNATTDANPGNYHTKYTTTYYKTFEAGEVVSIRTTAKTDNQNLVTLIQWGDRTESYDSSLKSLTYNGVSVPNFKATEARYTVYMTTADPVAIAAVQNDANATVNIDKESLTPSEEGDMATITVTSSIGDTRYYVTAKLTTEENKIVNLSTASSAGIYGTDGYNTDKTKQTDKYTIEDDLDIGTPAEGDTPAVNGNFGYNDRSNVYYTSSTSSFFKGATYIRTSKNDAGDVLSKRPYFSGNCDGKNGNPYWVEFVVTSDATVYFADTYYFADQNDKSNPDIQANATPWPNKPADWLVAQSTDDLAIHATHFHATPETGSVYYKHYKAGEVVQIPCYGVPSTWAADRTVYDPPVYLIVWDSDKNTNPDGGVDDGGEMGGSGSGGGTEDGGNQ